MVRQRDEASGTTGGVTTSLPIAELIEDMSVYPRHDVDGSHVRMLVDALKVGAVLPPIVVDRKSKRVVDGWHRLRAYRQIVGETGAVDVELVSFKTEADLRLDAIARNASHGRRFDKQDHVRIVLMCEEAGIDERRIAAVLNMPVERIPTLRVKFATAPPGSDNVVPGTLKIALKRPVAHFAGLAMTSEQARAHHSVPGTSYLLLAHQLHDALIFDLINQQDERLMSALRQLREVLVQRIGD